MPKKRIHFKKAKAKKPRFPFLKLFLSSFFLFLLIIGVYVYAQKKLNVCANSLSCTKNLSGVYEPNGESIYMGSRVNPPKFIADNIVSQRVLGQTTEQKHIYVDLANQKLMAFEGDKVVMEFPVSTGKWYPTPTGEFKIWIKLQYTRMSGGNPNDGTYYSLANVPYTMFFAGPGLEASRGFGLHGAYWHNNFGYPMSHGCVNIRPEDAKQLFYWADPVSDGVITRASDSNPGTALTIFGQPPV